MPRVAVIWIDQGSLRVFANPLGAAVEALGQLGARQEDGSLLLDASLLEEVCSELDRVGFVWAADRRFAPRTWAEHLFAEVPDHLWDRVVDALHPVFSGPGGDQDSLGLLLFARRGVDP